MEDFILSLHLEPTADERTVQSSRRLAADIASSLGIRPFRELRVPFDAMALRVHHDMLQSAECAARDWIVWADADEFHWLGSNLREIAVECEDEGHDAVRGHFVDRVARNGELIALDPLQSIWSQFPIGCNATSAIVGGMTKKVVMARAHLRIRHANHDPVRHQRVRWSPIRAAVFHFKWDANVRRRLEARLSPDWKARCPWWVQSSWALAAIAANSGRLPLDRLKCFDFEDDDDNMEYFPYETNRRYREQWIYWQSAFPHSSQ